MGEEISCPKTPYLQNVLVLYTSTCPVNLPEPQPVFTRSVGGRGKMQRGELEEWCKANLFKQIVLGETEASPALWSLVQPKRTRLQPLDPKGPQNQNNTSNSTTLSTTTTRTNNVNIKWHSRQLTTFINSIRKIETREKQISHQTTKRVLYKCHGTQSQRNTPLPEMIMRGGSPDCFPLRFVQGPQQVGSGTQILIHFINGS